MKIAICFSGLLRTYKNCFPTWKANFFSMLDLRNIQYDIFFHTYYNSEESIDDIINLYNPKKFIIEKEHIRNINSKFSTLQSYWNSTLKSVLLIKEYTNDNPDYDMYFRARFDMRLRNIFNGNQLQSNDKSLLLLNQNDICFYQGYYSDICSVAYDYDTFLKANNPTEYIKKYSELEHPQLYNTSNEKVYTDYLLENNLVNIKHLDLDFSLLREDNSQTILQQTILL